MKATEARKLAAENKTKVNKKKADNFIKKRMIEAIEMAATNGDHSAFIDIPKDMDHESYHEYIIAKIVKLGYNIVVETLYGMNKYNRAYKVTWDK
jgi:hypothetical protein